ncbi:hypothetical protein LSAT2_026651, partial [Lamellibrachia satsuma]
LILIGEGLLLLAKAARTSRTVDEILGTARDGTLALLLRVWARSSSFTTVRLFHFQQSIATLSLVDQPFFYLRAPRCTMDGDSQSKTHNTSGSNYSGAYVNITGLYCSSIRSLLVDYQSTLLTFHDPVRKL